MPSPLQVLRFQTCVTISCLYRSGNWNCYRVMHALYLPKSPRLSSIRFKHVPLTSVRWSSISIKPDEKLWESLFITGVSVQIKQPGVWNWHLEWGGRVLETKPLSHWIDDMKGDSVKQWITGHTMGIHFGADYCMVRVEEKYFAFPVYPTSLVQESIQIQSWKHLKYSSLAFGSHAKYPFSH